MRRQPDVRPLAIVAAALTVLGAAGVVPVWAGVPHHVALPPLDLFADVRVLLAEAPSLPSFLAGLAAVITLRSIVLAAMLRSLDRAGLARAARFYGTALPIALMAGGLGFAGVAAVYSLFLWAGITVAVVAALLLGPRPWQPSGRPGRGAGRVAAYLGALLVLSLLSALGETGLQLLVVWASAVLTAATAHWLGRGHAGTRTRPVSATGAALALVALVALVAIATARPVPSATAPARPSPRGTLLVVPGIGGSSGTSTMFRLDAAALGYDCDHTIYFSYAGPGTGAPQRDARCPIRRGAPYRPDDTHRPLGELARSFRAQYAELEPPVVVVAHSQGGWVAAAALGRNAGVAPPSAVVLLGAFPGHRSGYQLDGTGAGVVGTDLLEALTATLRATGGTTFDPRAPLARQLLGTRGAVDDLMRQGFGPGVRVVTVTSAYDLPVMAGDRQEPGADDACPVYVHHGSLPRSSQVHDQIRRALQRGVEGGCGWWRRWPTQAFTAFAVPPP